MNNQLVILGAGGHAKVCYEIAAKMKQWEQIIILDDNRENDFFEISGELSTFSEYSEADFFVAIGSNNFRQKLIIKLIENNFQLATLIHPSAIISPTSIINNGTVVMPGVIVNANTTIGKGVILNTACTVDHDCNISNYVHISPGANVAGDVKIGSRSWIGIGATIIQGISIVDNCTIGAGSLVLKSIENCGVYYGDPLIKVRS